MISLCMDLCTLCNSYDDIQTYIDIERFDGVKTWFHVCQRCGNIPDDELRLLICNKYNIKDRRLNNEF